MQMLSLVAILQYTRNIEIFSQLLTFLAITSIIVWGIVIVSTIVTFCIRIVFYRRARADKDEYVQAIK